MALRDRAVEALRLVFGAEREERSTADSPSVAAAMAHSPSMFSVWGREDIGGLLTVSQSLMDRFADYESMEEYPDINCVAEGQRVYAIENSTITPVPIEQLILGGNVKEILGYDVKKKRLCAVNAENARMTGRDIEVLEIPLSNGAKLRVTGEHKLLTADRGYVNAEDISAGNQLMGMWAGFKPAGTTMLINPTAGVVTVTGDPKSGGKARVFDITTSTHNFVLEGAVVHNSAYHYYANDATQPSVKDNKTIWVASENNAILGIGNDLLHKKLRVEDEIWSQAYSLGMYGNNYDELLVTENGVIGLNHLPVPTVRRVERLDGGLIGFVQDVTGQFTANSHELRKMLAGQSEIPKSLALFEDWQVIHMRLRATRRRSPYGVSVAEGARWIWKRLVMMEDAVMIYKLTRSPARYAFYVDVTDLPSDRVEGYLRKMKRDFKKKKMVNPRTGRMDMRYSPLANDEDFVIAVREGRELARVEVLSGPDYQNVDDVEYFKKMLHGALRVPREYLGQDGGIPGKSILSNEDVRAARVTLNLQREIRLAYERIIRVHLAARGVRDPWKPEFEVEMTIPSGIYEMAAYEVLNARADYASRVQPFVSTRWIQENVLRLSNDDIEMIEKQRKEDAGDEQSGDVPSYAGGAGAGGAPMPVPPEGEGEGGQDVAQDGDGPSPEERKQGAPEARTQAASRSVDYRRRLEEWRYRESNRRTDEIKNLLGQLVESTSTKFDPHFAERQAERQKFFKDLRGLVLSQNGGGTRAAPPPQRPRPPRSRRRSRIRS
jgi:hypothetical protein